MAGRSIWMQIHHGMQVSTADGVRLAKVERIWYGSDPAEHAAWDDEVCSRLEVRHGFWGHEAVYVPVRVIAAVADTGVTLVMDAATVNEQPWTAKPKWIGSDLGPIAFPLVGHDPSER